MRLSASSSLNKRGFLAVLGLGGIAGRGADAAIFFRDQLVVGEIFVRRIAPIFLAHLFMHAFGEGFGQTVGQGAQQDGGVIVLGRFEALDVLVFAEARRHDKAADIIGHADGRDEIGQRQIGAARLARHLLAQCVQRLDGEFPRLVAIDENIVAIVGRTVGRPEADGGAGLSHWPSMILASILRIGEQIAGGLADLFVGENGGIGPGQFPGLEEGRPSRYSAPARPDRNWCKCARPEARRRRDVTGEIHPRGIGARLGQGQPLAAAFLVGMAMGDFLIFGADIGDIGRAGILREQARGHADSARWHR
jgi:hypothetical protein